MKRRKRVRKQSDVKSSPMKLGWPFIADPVEAVQEYTRYSLIFHEHLFSCPHCGNGETRLVDMPGIICMTAGEDGIPDDIGVVVHCDCLACHTGFPVTLPAIVVDYGLTHFRNNVMERFVQKGKGDPTIAFVHAIQLDVLDSLRESDGE